MELSKELLHKKSKNKRELRENPSPERERETDRQTDILYLKA